MDGNFDSADLIGCSLAGQIAGLVDFDCCWRIVVMCLVHCMFAALVDSIQTVVCLAAKMEFHWMLTVDDVVVDYYCRYLTMFLLAVAGDAHCRTPRIDCLWTGAAALAVADVVAVAFVYYFGRIVMAVNWFGGAAAAYFENHHCNRNCLMLKVVS